MVKLQSLSCVVSLLLTSVDEDGKNKKSESQVKPTQKNLG